MAAHSSVLAWRIPGTEEPSRLPSMGSHRVGHDWSDLAAAIAAGYWECRATKWLNPGKWKDLTLTGLEMVSVTEQALFPLFPQRMAECIGEWKLGSSCNDLLVPGKNSLWNVGGNVLITAWQYLWSDFVMPRKLHLFTYPLAISSHFALLT